jgi:hypothetical protein
MGFVKVRVTTATIRASFNGRPVDSSTIAITTGRDTIVAT